MLASLVDVLQYAERKGCAVGAFNTPNLECLIAVLNAAETLNEPAIIMHAEVHEPISPLKVIGPIMVMMAKTASVPVCVHLDHGETLDYLQTALDIGFTGIMYDGSALPNDENIANTIAAVNMAKKCGAGVEAEIGSLASREGGEQAENSGAVYTDPQLAKEFVTKTGIDALAPSFGTAHGVYKAAPKLDFERVAQIKATTGLSLVMHGGSGCSADDYHTVIKNGVRKINYYTYMSREGVRAVRSLLEAQDVTFFHDLAKAATSAMEQDVTAAIKLFTMK